MYPSTEELNKVFNSKNPIKKLEAVVRKAAKEGGSWARTIESKTLPKVVPFTLTGFCPEEPIYYAKEPTRPSILTFKLNCDEKVFTLFTTGRLADMLNCPELNLYRRHVHCITDYTRMVKPGSLHIGH